MIASLRNLDVRKVARRGEDAWRHVVIKVRISDFGTGGSPIDKADDFVEFVGADERVNFWKLVQNLASIAFHHASGDDEFLRATGLFEASHLDDGVDRFLLGRVDKAASVDDNNVSFARRRCEFMPVCGKLTHHDFCVDEVFRATETDESDFQGVVRPGVNVTP